MSRLQSGCQVPIRRITGHVLLAVYVQGGERESFFNAERLAETGISWCSRAMICGGGGAVRAARSEEDDGYTT